MSARIAPRLRALLSTLILFILRPPNAQGYSGNQTDAGDHAHKMQGPLVSEAADRMGERRGSIGDLALSSLEGTFGSEQRGPKNPILRRGKNSWHVFLWIRPGDWLVSWIARRNRRSLMCHIHPPRSGCDRLFGCPI